MRWNGILNETRSSPLCVCVSLFFSDEKGKMPIEFRVWRTVEDRSRRHVVWSFVSNWVAYFFNVSIQRFSLLTTKWEFKARDFVFGSPRFRAKAPSDVLLFKMRRVDRTLRQTIIWFTFFIKWNREIFFKTWRVDPPPSHFMIRVLHKINGEIFFLHFNELSYLQQRDFVSWSQPNQTYMVSSKG